MSSNSSPTLICLTPVKNEAWILDRFLQCASTWADHIIVADQHSDDGSRAIARSYGKVTLIDNDHPGYDERARQKLLIDAARDVPVDGKRILMALDADEILTANWMESPEWDRLLAAPPGTVLRFQWANVTPSIKEGWVPEKKIPFGFVDDGSPHKGYKIHSPRVPVPEGAPSLVFEDIHVLHYQYANWPRMKSKQRWYQCYERLEHPDKRPITIYRQYHHMDAARQNAEPLPQEWFAGYENRGIDMTTVPKKEYYYWDEQLVKLFQEHGTNPFQRLDVWNVDWSALGEKKGIRVNGRMQDPRTRFDRSVHQWLAQSQSSRNSLHVRIIQKILQLAGW